MGKVYFEPIIPGTWGFCLLKRSSTTGSFIGSLLTKPRRCSGKTEGFSKAAWLWSSWLSMELWCPATLGVGTIRIVSHGQSISEEDLVILLPWLIPNQRQQSQPQATFIIFEGLV